MKFSKGQLVAIHPRAYRISTERPWSPVGTVIGGTTTAAEETRNTDNWPIYMRAGEWVAVRFDLSTNNETGTVLVHSDDLIVIDE